MGGFPAMDATMRIEKRVRGRHRASSPREEDQADHEGAGETDGFSVRVASCTGG